MIACSVLHLPKVIFVGRNGSFFISDKSCHLIISLGMMASHYQLVLDTAALLLPSEQHGVRLYKASQLRSEKVETWPKDSSFHHKNNVPCSITNSKSRSIGHARK